MRNLFAMSVLLAAVFAAPLSAQVHTVGAAGDFTSLADAVAAAAEGDTLVLVDSSTFGDVTVAGKSLTIVAQQGAAPTLDGQLVVRDLGGDQQVVVHGLAVVGAPGDTAAVRVLNCAGPVLFQACAVFAFDNIDCEGLNEPPLQGEGQDAVQSVANTHLVFMDCALTGGEGSGGDFGTVCYSGGKGGAGLTASGGGMLHVVESALVGGAGGSYDGTSLGGDGGPGLSVRNTQLFAAASSAIGGDGGEGFDFIPVTGHGNGGTGLHTIGATHARLYDMTLAGGAAGMSAFGVPGEPGDPLEDEGATLFTLPGTPSLTTTTARTVEEGQALELSVTGTPGEFVVLFADVEFAPAYLQNNLGVFAVPLPALVGPLVLGPVPPSGVRSVAPTIPELGLDALPVILQGVLLPPGGGFRLSTSKAVTLLDAGF